MRPVRSIASLLVFAAPLFLASMANAEKFKVDPAESVITVNVQKSGAFAGMLHDHHFQPTEFSGGFEFDPANANAFVLRLFVNPASLHDHQPELSEKDTAKVEAQVRGAEVLDADRYPRIELHSQKLVVAHGTAEELDGTVEGDLTVHGVTRPIHVQLHARRDGEGWRVLGKTSFKQSDFGIKPLRKMAGAISVKDLVVVDFNVLASPSKGEK